MVHDTAGDPITGLKWTRKTTEKISRELLSAGLSVSRNTVGRLLKEQNYRLRVNHKKLTQTSSPHRNRQFDYIAEMRREYERNALPIVSVDTKKKELVGRFKNPGAVWSDSPLLVNDHDFRSEAVGMAIPYGIFDLQANLGHVFIGTSHDTPRFAVAALMAWWTDDEGRSRYPAATHLLILADGGGSNSSRSRAWKFELQNFCDRFNLTVTVCHYPPATSKWNPIEHRLFSEISKNWAGQPLETYDTILNFIRTTTTASGLRVKATLLDGDYPTRVKISDRQIKNLNLQPHIVLPQWNYTLAPATTKM
jgi:hypothetical protein